MSDSQFQPGSNGVAINTSTTSAAMAIQASNGICVTNRSNSNAWLTWNYSAPPTAQFPVPGDPVGQWGIEIVAQSQVTIGVAYQDMYVAAVLLSGTGVMTITPGDGL